MKTKKAIVQWWCDLRNLYPDNGEQDYTDFQAKIDKSVNIEIKELPNAKAPQRILTLTKYNWKHPLYLWFFYDGGCVKIAGF